MLRSNRRERRFPPRWLLGVVLITGSVTAADEPPQNAVSPSQAHLHTMLSGNSIEGQWAGRPYRQHFAPGGATCYQESGARPSQGRWRVNDQGQYCSIWPPSPNEACYSVKVQESRIFWRSGDAWYPSTLFSGDIFSQ